MRHTGGGKDIEAVHEPVILEKNGVKIGFLAYASAVFPYEHSATNSILGIATVKTDT